MVVKAKKVTTGVIPPCYSLRFLVLLKMKSIKKNEAYSLNSIRTLLLIYLLFSKPLVK